MRTRLSGVWGWVSDIPRPQIVMRLISGQWRTRKTRALAAPRAASVLTLVLVTWEGRLDEGALRRELTKIL